MTPNDSLDPDKQLSVGKVAEFCQVNRVTVQRWIHAEKLKAHSLPGGHYRVRVADLRDFFVSNGMPVPDLLKTKSQRASPRILIVDDSENDRLLLRTALQSQDVDIDIKESADGMDALLKIGDWKPALVVLDIMMPGMDGFEFIRKLSENSLSKGILILIVSGVSKDKVHKQLDGYPIAGFIGKPVDIEVVRSVVKELLAL